MLISTGEEEETEETALSEASITTCTRGRAEEERKRVATFAWWSVIKFCALTLLIGTSVSVPVLLHDRESPLCRLLTSSVRKVYIISYVNYVGEFA